MSTQFNLEEPVSGFSFENARRNLHLQEKGYKSFKTTKTGTTICALIYKDGIVFGADNRATAGNIIANKFTLKIHELAPNIVACGAGVSADCDKVTELLASQLKLHRLETGRQSRVVTAERILTQRLFQYQGHVQSYLILGGVDVSGRYIYDISAHGCASPKLYAATGSGMLGAMAELESRYKVNMTEEEAKELVKDAILAGIFNDNASGSNVDIAVTRISDGSMEIIRGYAKPNKKGERKNKYTYAKGTTAILSEVVKPIVIPTPQVQPMET
ncbi:PSMB7 [Lepeophtheirus salmonis]|uniref:Proteasome subunit beta n=1 Tax=Lepeophtheirus salmonis TaxID=72036 RepID=C1BVR3_LEPSM|nr:proteasome subunit beta type-7-like [Lepeophtheirus salmonis]ACO13116.1 Proteasome subunit beta type-7 precursor [Lepeophtheirus salmonis]ADD24177.1 Proteasome subunit beta type-7 [Lepeophtheirus salmonis]ADD38670.1 Proteasome subunit beta type-7 [Lepeophtheirus salmonis]CAB4055569.1 PSMB7 [Lepeophtheirus salmonis]CAF2777291.1 PSMB7 [Lepeophtheirus salmonis]